MPRLSRPDGVEIAWEECGQGPLVVLANQFFGQPEIFEDLLADLEQDHRIVTYDVRGTGESTWQGPYDLDTDADDLEALVEEAGGAAVVIGMADGCNRAVRVAAARPDLVAAVITPAGNPVGRVASEGTEGLAGSESVLAALLEMFGTDYRGALRSMFSSANPGLDEERVRERVQITVERCPQEAAVPRMRGWIDDNAHEQARALGGRLWMLEHGNNLWFSIEIAKRTRALLPEAHIVEVEDGPISRPDITAGIVRKITAAQRTALRAG